MLWLLVSLPVHEEARAGCQESFFIALSIINLKPLTEQET